MALLWFDGFDYLATADLEGERYTVNNGVVIGAAAGRDGGKGADFTNAGYGGPVHLRRTITTSGATVVFGAWIKMWTSAPSECGLFSVLMGGTYQGGIGIDGTMHLFVARGNPASGGTKLETSANALTLSSVHYLEFKYTIDAAAGAYEVRVDGAAWIGPTSDANTRGHGSLTTWDEFFVGSSSNAPPRCYLDDLYVLDGSGSAPTQDFLGACLVDAHFPTADGATNDWTASAGNRWDCVNETAPNDDTDYIHASTAGNKNTFVVEDLKNAGGTILGVETLIAARRLSGGFASICPVIRHSSTDYDGAEQTLAASYAFYRQLYVTNPGTGSAWTEAHFNAAEFGVKKVS